MTAAVPTNPDHLHDFLLDVGGEVFMDLEREYPGFAEATAFDDGSKIFFELREHKDGDNKFWLSLPMPTKRSCFLVVFYAPVLISKLAELRIEALRGLRVLYPVPKESGDEYDEEIFYSHDFKE